MGSKGSVSIASQTMSKTPDIVLGSKGSKTCVLKYGELGARKLNYLN